MKKILEYTKNVAASIGFALTDITSHESPAMHDFVSKNSDLFKDIIYDIKEHRQLFNRLTEQIKSNNIYKTAVEIKKSTFEDIKSGKFYNKQRQELFDNKSMGSEDNYGENDGMDDFDAMFGDMDSDIDIDDDYEPSSNGPTNGDHLVSDTIIESGASSTKALARTMVATSEYAVENSRSQHKEEMLRDYKSNAILHNALGNINKQLEFTAKSTIDILSTHATNSKNYYEKSIGIQSDIVGYLSEIAEMQRTNYKSSHPDAKKTKEDKRTYYDDVVQASGIADLKNYVKSIGDNIKVKVSDIAQLGSLFQDEDDPNANPYLGAAGSPLAFIPKAVANKLIGKDLMKAMSNLDSTVASTFGTTMALFNSIGNDENGSMIQKTIAELLVPRIRKSDERSPGDYNKGDMSWNGKGQKALTEVIPTLLAKQLSVMSGMAEKIYDYDRGQFVDSISLSKEYDNTKERYVNNTFSDIKREVINRVDELILMDYDQRKSFDNDLKSYFNYFFGTGELLNPNVKLDKLPELSIDDKNYELITGMLRNVEPHKLMKVNAELFNNKTDLGKAKGRKEDIYNALSNNSNLNETLQFKKDADGNDIIVGSSGTMSLMDTKDNFNNNVFDYLKNIRDILIEGIVTYPSFGGMGQQMPNGTPITPNFNIGTIDRNSLINKTKNNMSFEDKRREVTSRRREAVDKANIRKKETYEKAKKRAKEKNLKDWEDMELVNYDDVVADNSETFYKATYYQNQLINKKNLESDDAEWDADHQTAIDFFKDLLDFDDDEDKKLERKKTIAEINSRALENASKKDKKLRLPWSKKEDEVELPNEEKDKEGKATYIDGLLAADTVVDKFTYTSDKLSDILNKPTETITNLLNKVDKRIFEFFYGGEEVSFQGEKARGYMDMLVIQLNKTFEKLNEQINDKFLTPIREKLAEMGVFDKLNDWKESIKEKSDEIMTQFFGEKDEKGWRHGGVFGDFTEQFGNDIKGLFGGIFSSKKTQEENEEFEDYVGEITSNLSSSATSKVQARYNSLTNKYDASETELQELNKQAKELEEKIAKLRKIRKDNKFRIKEYDKDIKNANTDEERKKLLERKNKYVQGSNKIVKNVNAQLAVLHQTLNKINARRKELEKLLSNKGVLSNYGKQQGMTEIAETPEALMTTLEELNKQDDSNIVNQLKYIQEQNDIKAKFETDSKKPISPYMNMQANPSIYMSNMMAKVSDAVNLLSIIKDKLFYPDKAIDNYNPTNPDKLNLINNNGLNNSVTEANKVLSNTENFNRYALDKDGTLRERTDFNDYETLLKTFNEADAKEEERIGKLINNKEEYKETLNAEVVKSREKWSGILSRKGIDLTKYNLNELITDENYKTPWSNDVIRALTQSKPKKSPIKTNAYNGAIIGGGEDLDYDFLPTNMLNEDQAKKITKNVPFIENKPDETKNKITNQLLGKEKIPAFAEGAVVEDTTIASLGENGAEVVIPLKKMRYLEGTKRMFDGMSAALTEMYKSGKIDRVQFNKAIKDLDMARQNMRKKVDGKKADSFDYSNETIRGLMKDSMSTNNKPYDNEVDDRRLYNLKMGLADSSYRDMDFDNLDDLKKKSNDNFFRKNLTKFDNFSKSNYKDGLFVEVKNEIKEGASKFTSALFGIEEDKEEEFQTKLKSGTKKVYDEILDHLPEGLSGTIIGGISGALFPGVLGGPLIGAVLGASVNIIKNSETLQNKLFGTKDAKGHRNDDGMVPAEIVRTFDKYAPDTLKFGAAGMLAQLLPFVPGTPLTGLLVGSALAFAKNNENFQKYLFGDANEDNGLFKKKTQEKFKKALPKTLGGAAIGAISTLFTPFGLVGSTLVGGAIGALSTNDTVQQMLFGNYDPVTKKRENGLIPIIGDAITSPFKKLIGATKGGFMKFFDKKIKQPFLYAIQPFGKELKLIGKKLGGYVKNLFDETIGGPIKRFMVKWVFKPLGGILKGAISAPINLIKGTVGLGLGVLGLSGKSMRAKHIRRGDADYMTAEEREAFRIKNAKMFRPSLLRTGIGTVVGSAINPALGAAALAGFGGKGTLLKKDKFKHSDRDIMEFEDNMTQEQYYQLMDEIQKARTEGAEGVDPRYSSTKYSLLGKVLGRSFNQSDNERKTSKYTEEIQKQKREEFKTEVTDKRNALMKQMEENRGVASQEKLTEIETDPDYIEVRDQYHQMKAFIESDKYAAMKQIEKAQYLVKFEAIEKRYNKYQKKIGKSTESADKKFIKKYRKQFHKLDVKTEKFGEEELRYKKRVRNSFDNSIATKGMDYLYNETRNLAKERGFKSYEEHLKELEDAKKPKDDVTKAAEKTVELAEESNKIAMKQLECSEVLLDYYMHGEQGKKYKEFQKQVATVKTVKVGNEVYELADFKKMEQELLGKGILKGDVNTKEGRFENFKVMRDYVAEKLPNMKNHTDKTPDVTIDKDGNVTSNKKVPESYDPNKMTENELKKYSKLNEAGDTMTVITEEGVSVKYDKDASGHWNPVKDANFKEWSKIRQVITGFTTGIGSKIVETKDSIAHKVGFVGNLLSKFAGFAKTMFLGTVGISMIKSVWKNWLSKTAFGKSITNFINNPKEGIKNIGSKIASVWNTHVKKFFVEKLPAFLDKAIKTIKDVGIEVIKILPTVATEVGKVLWANKDSLLQMLMIYLGVKGGKKLIKGGIELKNKGAKFLWEKTKSKVSGSFAKHKAAKATATKFAEDTSEKVVKKAGEEAAKETGEKVAKETGEKVAKETAEDILQKTTKETAEDIAKKTGAETAETILEKTTANTAEDILEKAGVNAAKTVVEKTGTNVAEDVLQKTGANAAENIIKKTGAEVIQETTSKIGKEAGEEVIERIGKETTEKLIKQTGIKTGTSIVKKISGKIFTKFGQLVKLCGKGIIKVIKMFFPNLKVAGIEKILKKSTDVALKSPLLSKFTGRIASFFSKDIFKLLPLGAAIGLGFTVFAAIKGASTNETARLFGVAPIDVNSVMKSISSCIRATLEVRGIWVIDIIDQILISTGAKSILQELAIAIYMLLGDDMEKDKRNEKLLQDQSEFTDDYETFAADGQSEDDFIKEHYKHETWWNKLTNWASGKNKQEALERASTHDIGFNTSSPAIINDIESNKSKPGPRYDYSNIVAASPASGKGSKEGGFGNKTYKVAAANGYELLNNPKVHGGGYGSKKVSKMCGGYGPATTYGNENPADRYKVNQKLTPKMSDKFSYDKISKMKSSYVKPKTAKGLSPLQKMQNDYLLSQLKNNEITNKEFMKKRDAIWNNPPDIKYENELKALEATKNPHKAIDEDYINNRNNLIERSLIPNYEKNVAKNLQKMHHTIYHDYSHSTYIKKVSTDKQVSTGITFDDEIRTINNFPYWSQNNSKWNNLTYADGLSFGEAGCGPTALAMVATAYNKKPITPFDLMGMGRDYWADDKGTSWDYFDSTKNAKLESFNIKGTQIPNTWDSLRYELQSGHPVILSGVGDQETTPFTNEGHYAVATGMDGSDRVWINDPISEAESISFHKSTLFKKGNEGLETTQNMWAYTDIENKSLRESNPETFNPVDTTETDGSNGSGFFDFFGKLASGTQVLGDTIMRLVMGDSHEQINADLDLLIAKKEGEKTGVKLLNNGGADVAVNKYNGELPSGSYYNISSKMVNTEKLSQMPATPIDGDYLRKHFFTGSYDKPMLRPYADSIVEAAYKHGVNPIVLASLIATESGWGTSDLAKNKNNFAGYAAYDSDPYNSAETFESPAACFDKTAQLLSNNYINPGTKYFTDGSLVDVNKNYAPNNRGWSQTISSIIASKILDMDPDAQISQSSLNKMAGMGGVKSSTKKRGSYNLLSKEKPSILSGGGYGKINKAPAPASGDYSIGNQLNNASKTYAEYGGFQNGYGGYDNSVSSLTTSDYNKILSTYENASNEKIAISVNNNNKMDNNLLIRFLTAVLGSLTNIDTNTKLLALILDLMKEKLNINISEKDIKNAAKQAKSGDSNSGIDPASLFGILNSMEGSRNSDGSNGLASLLSVLEPLTK